MSSVNIDFTALSDVNPYVPPPDWLSVGQVQARILGNVFVSTAASNAVYIYDRTPTGLLTSSIVLGSLGSDSLGIAFCSSAGTGYQLLLRSYDARLFKVVAGVLGSQVGSTYTGTFALNDVVLGTLNTATGGFVFSKNGTQFRTFTDTTYSTGLRAGIHSRSITAPIKSVTVSDYLLQSVTSINSGSPFTASQTSSSAVTIGFSGLPATITSNVTGLTFSGIGGTTNAPTFTKSVRADGAVYPKDGVTATVTFTSGAESASTTIACNKNADETAVIVASPINDDITCLFGAIFAQTGRSAANGDEVYHAIPPEMLTNGTDTILPADAIQPDGTMQFYNTGTFPCWVWTAATGVNYYYSVTITESGEVIINGLTSSGLTSSGLTRQGLTSSGL